MKPPVDVKIAKPPCSGMISHVKVWIDQVCETGPSNKPISIQVNGARAKDPNDRKPETKERLNFGTKKKRTIYLVTHSEANKGGFRD